MVNFIAKKPKEIFHIDAITPKNRDSDKFKQFGKSCEVVTANGFSMPKDFIPQAPDLTIRPQPPVCFVIMDSQNMSAQQIYQKLSTSAQIRCVETFFNAEKVIVGRLLLEDKESLAKLFKVRQAIGFTIVTNSEKNMSQPRNKQVGETIDTYYA